jgi:hypothetical protein
MELETRGEKERPKKDDEVITLNYSKVLKKLRENPWILISAILTIILLIFITRGTSSQNISEKEVETLFLDFTASQGVFVEVTEINDLGNVYQIVFLIDGQEGPFYITKDGKYFGQELIPFELVESIEENTPSFEINENEIEETLSEI